MNQLGLASLFAILALPASAQVYNLAADWSDLLNPNGNWSYIASGGLALPGIRGGDSFSQEIPIWRPNGPSTTHIGWSKANGGESAQSFDLLTGDVFAHVEPSSPIGIRWTAVTPTTVTVTGGTWMLRDIGRSNSWALLSHVGLIDTPLSSGVISSGDAFSRSSAETISGSVSLGAGDWIEIDYLGTDYFGLALEVSAIPEPSSFVLFAALAALGAAAMRRRTRD